MDQKTVGDLRGYVCSESEAEVTAWGAKQSKAPLQMIYYKHSELQKGELIAQLLYTGLCHSDYFKLQSAWAPPERSAWPMVAGHEIIARVKTVGPDCKWVKVGDIVGACPHRDSCYSCDNCIRGDDNLCYKINKRTYDPYFGGYATEVKLSENWTFKIPEGMDLKRLSPILCAGITCYAPLSEHAKPGYKCAVVGIGGLGHMGVQFAVSMGMEVTAVSGSDDKEELCLKKLGAHHFLNISDKKGKQQFQNSSFDLLLNTGLTYDLQPLLDSLRKGGVLLQVGLPEGGKPLTFEHMKTITAQKSIVGGYIGNRSQIYKMLELAKLNDIYPIVEVYDFQDFPKAYHRMSQEKPHFRVVVDVKSYLEKKKK